MRVAFYGRVSTDDAQDPSLSIPRQLRKCNEALGADRREGRPHLLGSGQRAQSAQTNADRGERDWTS